MHLTPIISLPLSLYVSERRVQRTHFNPNSSANPTLSSTALLVSSVPCSFPTTLLVNQTFPFPAFGTSFAERNLCTAWRVSRSFE